uniref:Uncharacterized protein n=1 Tax=Oryza barthii TaxID=65489 RepID=A0A0D3ERC2_9ORYZ
MAIESDPARNERRGQHVVLLASPGAGHLLPVAELARRIVEHDGFTATIVTHTNFSSAEHSSTFSSLPPSISIAALPEVSVDDLPADARVETRILTVVRRALPHLRDLLRSLDHSPTGVAVFLSDLLSPRALAVAAELGIPRYVFCTSNLMCLTSFLHNPVLDRTTTCEFRDLPGPVLLPGCVPLHGSDLVDPVQDRANPVYRLVIEMGLDYLRADGFLVNTFDAMEHDTAVAFKELSDKGVYPPAYAVGPFVRKPAGDVHPGGATLLPRHAQPGEPVREAVTVEMAPETVVQAALSRKQSANSSPHSGSAQESVSPSILSKASPGREGEGRKEADVYRDREERGV